MLYFVKISTFSVIRHLMLYFNKNTSVFTSYPSFDIVFYSNLIKSCLFIGWSKLIISSFSLTFSSFKELNIKENYLLYKNKLCFILLWARIMFDSRGQVLKHKVIRSQFRLQQFPLFFYRLPVRVLFLFFLFFCTLSLYSPRTPYLKWRFLWYIFWRFLWRFLWCFLWCFSWRRAYCQIWKTAT